MSLTIAVDFDHTYAADPEVFAEVVEVFLAAGHDVLLVTKRTDDGAHVAQAVYDTVTNDIPIIFVGGTHTIYKDELVRDEHALEVDIWIDDKPEFIRSPSQIKEELDQMILSKFLVEQELSFLQEYVHHLEDVVKTEAKHLWSELKKTFKAKK